MAAGDFTGKLITLVWQVGSLVTTTDGLDAEIIPHDCVLFGPVRASLGTAPAGAGSCKIQLRNSTDAYDLIPSKITITTTDADVAAEGTLSSTTSYLSLDDGDVIMLDVDSISTSATERDLKVIAHAIGR